MKEKYTDRFSKNFQRWLDLAQLTYK